LIEFEPGPLAALVTAATLGAMMFFAGVIAPAVFMHFPEHEAGAFIRRLFPRYYDVLTVTSAVAAIFAFGTIEGALLAAVAGLFIFSRFWLMPRINVARDAQLAGGEGAQRFNFLHRASVIINLAQIVVLLIVAVRLA